MPSNKYLAVKDFNSQTEYKVYDYELWREDDLVSPNFGRGVRMPDFSLCLFGRGDGDDWYFVREDAELITFALMLSPQDAHGFVSFFLRDMPDVDNGDGFYSELPTD